MSKNIKMETMEELIVLLTRRIDKLDDLIFRFNRQQELYEVDKIKQYKELKDLIRVINDNHSCVKSPYYEFWCKKCNECFHLAQLTIIETDSLEDRLLRTCPNCNNDEFKVYVK